MKKIKGIKYFQYKGEPIRAVTYKEKVLFSSFDVGKILRFNDPSGYVHKLCKYISFELEGAGPNELLNFIDIYEVYKLIGLSDRKDKSTFRDWIEAIENNMKKYDLKLPYKILTLFARDKFLDYKPIIYENAVPISEIGKQYNLSSVRMNRILKNSNIQTCKNGKWELLKPYSEGNYIEYYRNTRRWTSEGQKLIHKLMDSLKIRRVK